jgi:hypothetical protein
MSAYTKVQRLKDTSGPYMDFHVGDSRSILFIIKDKSGTAVDLTGKTIRFRLNTDDSEGSVTNAVFMKNGTLTDATAGKVTLALLPANLVTADEGEDRHLWIIDVTSSTQRILGHFLVNVLPDPDAAGS